MAQVSIRKRNELAWPAVLAPERYDPRRDALQQHVDGVRLGDLAALVRKVVAPGKAMGKCMVFDTSDAREGVLVTAKPVIGVAEIGSAKKVATVRDVVVSRLRPYLRQVAWVDPLLVGDSEEIALLFSTEFFVLRPLNDMSLAFLVPFLLSEPVQSVLGAAQEGGHHPRFNEDTLLNLPVPGGVIAARESISVAVERAVSLHRAVVNQMEKLIVECEDHFSNGQ